MLGFDTPLNVYLVAAAVLAALVTAARAYRGYGPSIGRRYIAVLASLRALGIFLLGAVLLDPFIERTEPDPENYRALFLADASASMSAKDCGGESRLGVLNGILKAGLPELLRFEGTRAKHFEQYLFSEKPVRFYGGEARILPGGTAIGDTLAALSSGEEYERPSAVVLLSDGNSNTGTNVIEAAKKMAAAGIPLSCVGIGEMREDFDLSVHGPVKPLEGRKGQALEIPVKIKNSFKEDADAEFDVYEGKDIVFSGRVSAAARGETEAKVSVTPSTPGRHVYLLKLRPGALKDVKPETDIDFASVLVAEPAVFRILWLGDRISTGYRFLKMHLSDSRQFEMDALIRTGEDSWFRTEKISARIKQGEKGFPKNPSLYMDYDVIVADFRSGLMDESGKKDILEGFAGSRGGGVLFTAGAAGGADVFKNLLPVRASSMLIPQEKTYLDVKAPFIFPEAQTQNLRSMPGPFLPAGRACFTADELKPGARTALEVRGTGQAVLCVQQYGSGRTAWLGIDSDWRWHLDSDEDMERYTQMWDNLLVWLASGAKKRIRLGMEGIKFPVNEEARLKAEVLDADYRPAVDADLSAVVTAPDGSAVEMPLLLSADRPGEYSDAYVPSVSGEYRVSVRAKFRDGSEISSAGSFIAAPAGCENTDTAYRDDLLADASRITGGTFVHYKDLGKANSLPLKKNVAVKRSKFHLADMAVLPALMLAFFAAEWYMRRRIGLK